MNQHLIDRLAEEWAQLDPTDPLRGLISDAIAEINKQPAQQEPCPLEEMQEEILRLSEIISTNAFYKAGHANALEWAAEMAVLEDPRTSDWVYDDPHELAKALRKGPDFPSSPQPAQRKPLTDEEIDELADQHPAYLGSVYPHAFARAIEAAHGIKGDA